MVPRFWIDWNSASMAVIHFFRSGPIIASLTFGESSGSMVVAYADIGGKSLNRRDCRRAVGASSGVDDCVCRFLVGGVGVGAGDVIAGGVGVGGDGDGG